MTSWTTGRVCQHSKSYEAVLDLKALQCLNHFKILCGDVARRMASVYKARLSMSGSEDKLYRMSHQRARGRERENHNTAHVYGCINLGLILNL